MSEPADTIVLVPSVFDKDRKPILVPADKPVPANAAVLPTMVMVSPVVLNNSTPFPAAFKRALALGAASLMLVTNSAKFADALIATALIVIVPSVLPEATVPKVNSGDISLMST